MLTCFYKEREHTAEAFEVHRARSSTTFFRSWPALTASLSLSLIRPMWGPHGLALGGTPLCTWDVHGVACPMPHTAWGVSPDRAWVREEFGSAGLHIR